MASKKIRGIQVEIGGNTTKLGDAIADSEKHTKSLQNELKEVDRLLKFDPSNTELLAQKQRILSQAVDETTDKLRKLEDAEEQVIAQFKKGDIGEDQLRAFQREIMDTENKLNGFQDELKDTEGSIKDIGDSAGDSTDGFTIMKGALADLVSSAISSAVSAIGDLVGALFELSEATEEYRSMQAKLEGSANTFGYSADFAKSKYEEFYKYLGDDQMATNAITNLMGLGTTTESVSKLAEGATAVWASYGDSIPIESLTESINETVNAGKVTGTFADTINWCKDANEQLNNALSGNKSAQKAYNDAIKEGMSAEDAFNEALVKVTDEQERADIVAKFLNDTYGESKKAYDELNDSVLDANESELALKDTQAELGETMAPVNNAITDLKNKALEAIAPLVEKLADSFMNLYNWLKEHPNVLKAITAVVIALTTSFTILAGVLAIQGLINGVTKAFAFLNTTMLANPIVLIVALIAGLVTAFIYLWNNCDAFRNFWIKLWNGIKSMVANVVEWFKTNAPKIAQFFVDAWNKIKECWSVVTGFFKNIWTGIKNAFSNVGSWFSDKFRSAYSNVKKAWSSATNFFSGIWTKTKKVFSNTGSWFKSTFSKAWRNVRNVFSNWGEFFSGLWDRIKNTFSKLGTSLGSAIGDAVKSGINSVLTMIENTINKAIGLINGAIRIINKIPGVSVPQLNTLKLPRLARGGIVDEPTIAEIGENGREAIIPLEKNTEWLDEVAKRLNDRLPERSINDDRALYEKLDRIYERLDRMQIVLDSGTLVGETIDKIDTALANRQLLTARGV